MRTATRTDIGASVLRYLVAVWTVGLAFAATLLISPLVRPGVSQLFLLAVMISAWRGGMWAGLLATVLSALASAFVFLPPTYSLRIDRNDWQQLAVFTFAAVIIGTLSAARRWAEDEREASLVREQVARIEAERANAAKPFEPDELLVVIAGILRRVERTHAEIARIVGRAEAAAAESEFIDEDLTEAEARIAGAVARGLSNKDIAQEFRISVRTVEHHVQHILAKKNFSNRVELALHVKERGTNG